MRSEFVLDGVSHALRVPLALAGRVETIEELIAVPLAPSGVVGLGEVGGRAVTLVSASAWALQRLAHEPVIEQVSALDRAAALVLAPPFEHLAIFLPSAQALRLAGPNDQQIECLEREMIEQWMGPHAGDEQR